LSDWITGIIEDLGYWGVALLTMLENIFPPLPSEVIMPMAGFTASQGDMTLWGAVAAGTAGSVAGGLPWYYAGRWLGEERFRRWVERRGKWLTLEPKDVDRAKSWFDERGSWAVFIGRLIPGIRTLISAPAGFGCMPLGQFLLWTTLGTVIWTAALTYAGYLLGDNYDKVGQYLKPISTAVVVALAVMIAVWFWRRKRSKRESGGSSESAEAEVARRR